MSWKSELIGREDQTEDFLRRHLNDAGIENVKTRVLYDKASFYAETIRNGGLPFFSIRLMFRTRGEMIIKDLTVHEENRDFGSMLLKAAFAAAASRSCSHVVVDSVCDMGRSYWPRRGSLPIVRDAGLSTAQLYRFMRRDKGLMDADVRTEVTSLRNLAKQSPLQAWRALSQSDAKLDNGQPIRYAVFQNMDPRVDHVILPGLAGTKAVLEKRLGLLPQLPPIEDVVVKRYAHVIAGMEGKAVAPLPEPLLAPRPKQSTAWPYALS